jgi:hypothetical protein
MKITRFTIYRVAPRWTFLKIETDEGTGWGEPVLEGRARTVEMAVNELAETLIGRDPLRINDHWQSMYRSHFHRGGPILMSAIAGASRSRPQRRKSLLYSNGRTTVALSLDASGWAGFIKATRSSGTITDGTSRIALSAALSQADPTCALEAPAGMALQAGGSDAGSSSLRLRHIRGGMSMRTRYRFRGRPVSSICAAVSRTAMAIVGAAYRTA